VENHSLKSKTSTVPCYYITTKSKLQQQFFKNFNFFQNKNFFKKFKKMLAIYKRLVYNRKVAVNIYKFYSICRRQDYAMKRKVAFCGLQRKNGNFRGVCPKELKFILILI